MTIRFAAAANGTMPAIAGALCTGAPLDAANDNPSRRRAKLRTVGGEAPSAEIAGVSLAAALMHFARYGLSAAAHARAKAEAAHAARDTAGRAHWLGICHHLDRRMAAATARRLIG